MSKLSLADMQGYLCKSLSSLNRNKLNGLLAEIDFRSYLHSLEFQSRVSMGGWIARCQGSARFGHDIVVFFPETITPETLYPHGRTLPNPSSRLHTICATFHQIGIKSYYCTPIIQKPNDPLSIEWNAIQLGLPTDQSYQLFPSNITGFNTRERNYNFLRYNTDVSSIPEHSVPEEFAKEHLRVTFQNRFMAEISDVDGILWGNQYTYPIEIKEKTPAKDRNLGEYFGLDVGPFVKLAFYAAKKGNLHSIFVVREIDDVSTRNLVGWLFITFERMAQFASWVPQEGGTNMQGGRSSVIKIPKAEFQPLNSTTIQTL